MFIYVFRIENIEMYQRNKMLYKLKKTFWHGLASIFIRLIKHICLSNVKNNKQL